ncbi:serine hydrolase domain-containing protein [Maricaulis parjimensis]|uniref:serine hydrolase domain-containing protein n=1 Tax=Maricaulis parjimensis TaxID=144023 RepID=UPI0019393624|nr:serine hydrolase domain-containing protein [Maricaulis parjimensis]
MKSIFLGVSALALTCLAGCGETPSSSTPAGSEASRLDAAARAAMGEAVTATTPGCVVGATRAGEFVFAQGYGLANLEHAVPITPDTVFRMGSVSKQFTAAAIALLASRGALDLDAEIHTILPELTAYDHPVTIRQMVHHMSGMGDYDGDFEVRPGEPFRFGNEDYWTIEQFYAAVAQQALSHEPGTQWQYSNLAYFLLSQVVERVSGQSLADYAQAELFTPLGMDDTLFNDDVNQVIPNRASGYRALEDGGFETFDTNLDWVGDGGLYTTLNDMRQWDNALTANALPDGIAQTMLAPAPHAPAGEREGWEGPITYGYGMFLGQRYGQTYQGHSGGWVGFTTAHMRAPDSGLTVMAMCNGTAMYGPTVASAVFDTAITQD